MPEFVVDRGSVVKDETVRVPLMMGEIPGNESAGDEPDPFAGTPQSPPVDPIVAAQAMMSSGALMALGQIVAQGSAGTAVRPRPRKGSDPDSDQARAELSKLEVFLATGFRTQELPCVPMTTGFRMVEADRFVHGWGACGVIRAQTKLGPLPPEPIAIHAVMTGNVRAYRPTVKSVVMVPVPVATSAGLVWTEVPALMRRYAISLANGHKRWYKSIGDWRAMDARTGKFSSGASRTPDSSSPTGWRYNPGKLSSDADPAGELMHFSTYFPGAAPYGVSAWHAELDAVKASDEHGKLVLTYLKSGIHGLIIAAANRPFETAQAKEATDKISKLGRGREGFAALVTIGLAPVSATQTTNPSLIKDDTSSDLGRLILHQMSTTLPTEVLSDTLTNAIEERLAHAERIPTLLMGKASTYSSATSAAAWAVANRLRFMPCHREHDDFLNSLLPAMGITQWTVETVPDTWKDEPSVSSIGSVAGQFGGLTINDAMAIMSGAVDARVKPVERWWGNLPMSLVTAVLNAEDPYSMLVAIVGPGAAPPRSDFEAPGMLAELVDRLDQIEKKLETTNLSDSSEPLPNGTDEQSG